MRAQVRDFVRLVSDCVPTQGPVYEFGSYLVPGQEEVANLRPLFEKHKVAYVGCDMCPGPGVDRVENLHSLSIETASVGTVLCLETLEHVEDCRAAVEEMFRVLKPGGLAIISSGMKEIIHPSPSDYWRFTPEGFESLLMQFTFKHVIALGQPFFPHTVLGLGFKGESSTDPSALWAEVDKWQQQQKEQALSIKQVAKLVLPEGLLFLYLWLRFGYREAIDWLRERM